MCICKVCIYLYTHTKGLYIYECKYVHAYMYMCVCMRVSTVMTDNRVSDGLCLSAGSGIEFLFRRKKNTSVNRGRWKQRKGRRGGMMGEGREREGRMVEYRDNRGTKEPSIKERNMFYCR